MICLCGCKREIPVSRGERAKYFSIDCRKRARNVRRAMGLEAARPRRSDGERVCPGCGKAVTGRKKWCGDVCSRRAAVEAARKLKAERKAAALAAAQAGEAPKFVGCSVCGKKLTLIGKDGLCNFCRSQQKITERIDSLEWEIATTGRVTVDHLKYGSGGSIRCRKIG